MSLCDLPILEKKKLAITNALTEVVYEHSAMTVNKCFIARFGLGFNPDIA